MARRAPAKPTRTNCNTLQHTAAARCNTLQHAATHWRSKLAHRRQPPPFSCELRVNEERRRLAARLAWLAAGVQTEWRCCELRVNEERGRLAERLAWLAAGVQTKWRL